MSNNIHLKKGLNIPVSGVAGLCLSDLVSPEVIAIQPSDFKGLVPRLLVREGDRVKAGSPVMADKKNQNILVTSPISGTVKAIVRAEKRKLQAILIAADGSHEAIDFGKKNVDALSAEEVKTALLESGLWLSFIQRPYGIIADPDVCPKAIFVSTFHTAPVASEIDFTCADEIGAIQAGASAVSKLSEGGIHFSFNADKYENSPFVKLRGFNRHFFSAEKHPAGNVGVQISHISPIQKGETVWTISPMALAAIGKLFLTGRYDVRRRVAITGPAAIDPSYISTLPGMPISCIHSRYGADAEQIRFVSGDILSGKNVGENGYLGYYDDQITLVKEGTEPELLGWARPFRFNQFSADHSYFHWCLGKLVHDKPYDLDTNLHGGPRAFVMSDSYYGKVLPMDIYPLYLVKACLAGDIEKMEQFGIYEVLPEDFAIVEFIDPSKNNIQDIIANGIDLMLKEMA